MSLYSELNLVSFMSGLLMVMDLRCVRTDDLILFLIMKSRK